jgi:hypothetical protein
VVWEPGAATPLATRSKRSSRLPAFLRILAQRGPETLRKFLQEGLRSGSPCCDYSASSPLEAMTLAYQSAESLGVRFWVA